MDRDAAHHLPVLREETVELLAASRARVILDCTIGLGGHAEALLEAAGPEARLIGVDRDEANLRQARQNLERFRPRVRLFQANFADVRAVLAEAGEPAVDAVLADLGVASTQLDDPQRGMSFMADGPLDMRMDPTSGPTAADLLARWSETQMADVLYQYGQERYSRRIARAIVQRRKAEPIRRTGQLAALVASAMPAAVRATRRGVHPATRTFQALRIAVNDEMGSLEALLSAVPEILRVGGRAGIISFHSLEDGKVKVAFASGAAAGTLRLLARKPVVPTAEEVRRNPRSRSAKLRGVERIG